MVSYTDIWPGWDEERFPSQRVILLAIEKNDLKKKRIYLDIHLFNRCLLTICCWVNFVENPQFGKGRQKINKSLKYTIAVYNKGVQKVLWEHWEEEGGEGEGERS